MIIQNCLALKSPGCNLIRVTPELREMIGSSPTFPLKCLFRWRTGNLNSQQIVKISRVHCNWRRCNIDHVITLWITLWIASWIVSRTPLWIAWWISSWIASSISTSLFCVKSNWISQELRFSLFLYVLNNLFANGHIMYIVEHFVLFVRTYKFNVLLCEVCSSSSVKTVSGLQG